MAPGRNTRPVVFVESITGTMARRTERRASVAVLWRGEAPSARLASIWGRLSAASSSRRTAVTEATFMQLPISMPPMGIT